MQFSPPFRHLPAINALSFNPDSALNSAANNSFRNISNFRQSFAVGSEVHYTRPSETQVVGGFKG
jgi:hypothetical protein